MKKFMQTHKVYLTPLSPIHIGCGEDFEPTNYVPNNEESINLLYYFDPSKVFSSLESNEFREFSRYASIGDYEEIKKFFIKNKKYILDKDISSYQVLIPKEFQKEWETKLIIKNKLQIERNSYLGYPFNQPYIPASGFKGALVTAILDFEYSKKPLKQGGHQELLNEYIGTFQESKMKNVKFSDFTPTHSNVISQVVYATNFEKFEEDNGSLPVRRESIIEKQYRAYQSSFVINENKEFRFDYHKEDLIKILNRYYISVFKKEMTLLVKRNLVHKSWFDKILSLLSNHNIALIRLGKNGSDSKVYQDKSITKIKTKVDKKTNEILPESTTIWLSRESSKANTQYPFGWALLEFDIEEDNQNLIDWCNGKQQSLFDRSKFLNHQKEKQEMRLSEKRKKEAEAEEKRLAEQKAEEEKQALLNSLSDNQRLVESKIEEWWKMEVKSFNATPNVFSQAKAFLQEVHTLNWSKEDRQYLYDALDPTDKEKIIYKKNTGLDNFNKLSAKSAVEFKKLRNKLVVE